MNEKDGNTTLKACWV